MSLLQGLFITIVNMSITASYAAVGVILIRLPLKKAPKIFSYILWAPVLFRLVCPFSFNSVFSFFNLINLNAKQGIRVSEFVPQNIGLMQTPEIQTGIGSIDSAVNASLPPAIPAASVNPMQIWMAVLSLIWISGIIALLLYGIVSYAKTKRRLRTATRVEAEVFETDAVGTAFVCGFIRPKIYVPANIGDADLSYILEHERTHIRRKDYLIKPLAFLSLILHWFNPLMWLCFALMSRDMEMSCDESVLHRLGDGAKGGYSNSLLSLSVKRKGILVANPLAFGENHAKARIKNVLNFKKPAFWVTVVAVLAVCAAGFAFATDKQNGKDLYWGYSIQTLMDNKTPYAGNNSKVVGLIDAMPLPKGIARDTVELQTAGMPYGITINYIMTDSADIEVNGAKSDNAFHRNAIVLFSLIDNADVINCKIADKTGKYDGAVYTFTYTREAAEELLGKELRFFAQNADAIRSLIDMINDISFEKNYNSAAYISEDYKVSFKYPPNWKLNSNFAERYEGEDGFFQVGAINGESLSIDEVAKNDAFHKLNPYGSDPKIVKRLVDGQEARLILPSADQPEEMRNQAGLIVKYPEAVKINGSLYHYLILWADEAHIEQIGNTLNFLRKQTGNENSPDRIASIIEENLAAIMSSPKNSSNPQDYINVHQTEYKAILALETQALPYMFAEFEKGGQTGLKGHIMQNLCWDILGEDNIQYASKNPQDWYETFKKHIQRITASSSVDFVKANNPKYGALLDVINTPGTEGIAKLVEENLAVIMSSPQKASSPYAYIQEHRKEYENVIKYGGEEALQYMLVQFERGNANGLRGAIMMRLCKELLGGRNNVADETLTPQEWYDALSIRQEVKLPDFVYDGNDPIEKLVYATEIEKNSQPQRGFTIVAPKIFGSYEEDGLLKVFVTTFSATYKLYGNVLDEVGGSVIPSAITYKKDNSGNYVLKKYEQAKDGADWQPSIKKFCTMPVSGKEILGLADKIIDHYGNYDDIRTLRWENLFKHLKANGIKDATLFNSQGEVEFSMSNPQYAN